MSYYIYCYQSRLGELDLEEAQNTIEIFEEQSFLPSNYEYKLEVAQLLMACNPNFEQSDFSFDATLTAEKDIASAERHPAVNIQLNAITDCGKEEIIIFNNNVSISIPFLHENMVAEQIFEKLVVYTKIIGRIRGYFVYDPQAEIVYDPLKTCPTSLPLYLKLAKKEAGTSD